jgi:hypothetical protein
LNLGVGLVSYAYERRACSSHADPSVTGGNAVMPTAAAKQVRVGQVCIGDRQLADGMTHGVCCCVQRRTRSALGMPGLSRTDVCPPDLETVARTTLRDPERAS